MQIAKFQTRNVLPQVKVILAVMEQLKKLQINPRKKNSESSTGFEPDLHDTGAMLYDWASLEAEK